MSSSEVSRYTVTCTRHKVYIVGNLKITNLSYTNQFLILKCDKKEICIEKDHVVTITDDINIRYNGKRKGQARYTIESPYTVIKKEVKNVERSRNTRCDTKPFE